jgi:hypothetical protein
MRNVKQEECLRKEDHISKYGKGEEESLNRSCRHSTKEEVFKGESSRE